MSQIRIVIVDDHEVVRMGLSTLIDSQDDMIVVGEAGTAEEALEITAGCRPDLVVLDVRLPDLSGIETCDKMRRQTPETEVVILTSYGNDSLVLSALKAGAAGYVLKQVGNRELLRTIRAVAAGETALDPLSMGKMIRRLRHLEVEVRRAPFRELTRRELDILLLVARGKSNREIAEVIQLGETTVRNYVSSMLQKLNVTNRIELAVLAVEHGLRDDEKLRE